MWQVLALVAAMRIVGCKCSYSIGLFVHHSVPASICIGQEWFHPLRPLPSDMTQAEPFVQGRHDSIPSQQRPYLSALERYRIRFIPSNFMPIPCWRCKTYVTALRNIDFPHEQSSRGSTHLHTLLFPVVAGFIFDQDLLIQECAAIYLRLPGR